MINNEIKVTSEELIKLACKRFTTHATEKPDALLAEVIHDLYPNQDSMIIRSASLENSTANLIDKINRKAAEYENEFIKIGQLSLFGADEHKVPKQLMPKPVFEVREWMAMRSRIEQENLAELRKAVDAQERKADKFAYWNIQVERVYQGVIENNLNPNEVTYEEAVKMSETIQ